MRISDWSSDVCSSDLAKALVHTVAGTTYLVSPGVFQRYAQEYLQVAALAKQEKLEGWQWVQKRFEKLGQHRKQPSGLNIRSEEHTSELQSLMRISYAVFCLKKKKLTHAQQLR